MPVIDLNVLRIGAFELAERPEQFKLAVSLHSPDSTLRKELIPLEKRWPLPELIEALSNGLQGGFLVGGLASAEQLAVQIADRAVGGGVSGVLFNGRVAIRTGLTQGCSLIGQKHVITRGERNIIESIDDRPALDVFKESIGDQVYREAGLGPDDVDVAEVRLGPQMRRGIADLDGEGEVVGGIVVMRYGENALKTDRKSVV